MKVLTSIRPGNIFAEVPDLLSWFRRMMSPLGLWPKDKNDLACAVSCIYIGIFLSVGYTDLVLGIGSLEHLLANLSYTVSFTILLMKLPVFHDNHTLSQIIDSINEDWAKVKLGTLNEQIQYRKYFSIAVTIHIIFLPIALLTSIFYAVTPLVVYLFATNQNSTTPYPSPYDELIFFTIPDLQSYVLTYIFQVGAIYFSATGSLATDGLTITLLMHVCGQLAVLSENIMNLKKNTKDADDFGVRDIVNEHLRLIKMAEDINREFSTIFFRQMFACSLLVCIGGFHLVMNYETTKMSNSMQVLGFEITLLTVLFNYCFAGECLIEESLHVNEALYQCDWYDMPPSQSKDLILSMARSQKPLRITPGKVCVFSLELFAEVIKTAAGYISVLRTLV